MSDGFAQSILPGDIVINEVLFNPAKGGYDYIEGYNRSSKILDLEKLMVANRNAAGGISAMKPVARAPSALSPGSFFIVTSNEEWLRQHYTIGPGAVIYQVSLPSFPDDEGTVVFINDSDTIIDELHYSEKWHYPLISDPEAVALERIHYDAPTQDKNNWTSASSSSGFGTPGFQNSHFRSNTAMEEEFMVSTKIFTPDNDGINDYAVIAYRTNESGWLANLFIYSAAGRRIKYLLKNEILGTAGTYHWDGLDDQLRPAPSGIYILHTEIFNLKGSVRKFKHVIILRRGSG